MTKTTILHLSDLHRDSGSRLRTQPLLSSLVRDRKRYTENENIPQPDIAVISGDIVYGVKGDDPDGNHELELQYNEAYDTLAGLADRFFDGDRERIILAPGNHDVSMPHVAQAIRPVDIPSEADKKRILIQKIFEHESVYRLNLPELSVYEIINQELYNQRFEPYANFYERFYGGCRKFSLVPEDQYSIHEFPNLGVCIVSLSSCLDNDLFNRTGAISVEAITRAMDEIAQKKNGYIVIGVWHHSIQGGPKENDYIDSDFLRLLMDSNCSIGMHGHQHRSGLLENRFSPDVQRQISVISAGTLCGGPRSLPVGRMRGYNVVVLDRATGVGTLHVRMMSNSDFSSPIWERGYVSEFGGSSINFDFKKEEPAETLNVFQLAGEADVLIQKGQAKEAYEIIKDNLGNPWVREVAVRALTSLGDWDKLVDLVYPPSSVADFLILCEIYEELRDWDSLRSLISADYAGKFKDSVAVRHQIEISQTILRAK
jgi:hypothetical protein